MVDNQPPHSDEKDRNYVVDAVRGAFGELPATTSVTLLVGTVELGVFLLGLAQGVNSIAAARAIIETVQVINQTVGINGLAIGEVGLVAVDRALLRPLLIYAGVIRSEPEDHRG